MRIKRTTVKATEDLILELRQAEDQAKDADRRLKLARAELLDRMMSEQQKTVEHADGGKILRATVVSPLRFNVDEAGMFQAMSDEEKDASTTPKFVRSKFEALLDEISVERREELLAHVSEAPASPYVRFSIGEADDAAEGH